MPTTQTADRNIFKARKRVLKKKYAKSDLKSVKVDTATLASRMQLEEERRDLIYSFISLLLKSGLLFIGVVSLLKLGTAGHQRMNTLAELSKVLDDETIVLRSNQRRFDSLFTIGGSSRFLNEQEQWIEPNSVRVIWK